MNAPANIWRRIVIRSRRPALLCALVALPLLYGPVDRFGKTHALLINASPSLPNWAFWLERAEAPQRGALIFFAPPRSTLLVRHFGTTPQIFGKRVLGMPGDRVTHKGALVFINARQVAVTKRTTRLGIPLTRGPDGIIPRGCYYAGSAHPDGFDSRYGEIGFVCAGQILGSGRAIL